MSHFVQPLPILVKAWSLKPWHLCMTPGSLFYTLRIGTVFATKRINPTSQAGREKYPGHGRKLLNVIFLSPLPLLMSASPVHVPQVAKKTVKSSLLNY